MPAIEVINDAAELARRAKLSADRHTVGSETFAFYSSVTNAISTDVALMQVPIDDHQVHRGHAVFDTCNVEGGRVRNLHHHLERFLRSAKQARVEHAYSAEQLRSLILQTIAASGKKDMFVRYWLSAGRGNFGWSPNGCTPTFYGKLSPRRLTCC